MKERKGNAEPLQLGRQNHQNSMRLRQVLWLLETCVAQRSHKSFLWYKTLEEHTWFPRNACHSYTQKAHVPPEARVEPDWSAPHSLREILNHVGT